MMWGMTLTETRTEDEQNECEEAGDGVHYRGMDIPLEITFTSPKAIRAPHPYARLSVGRPRASVRLSNKRNKPILWPYSFLSNPSRVPLRTVSRNTHMN